MMGGIRSSDKQRLPSRGRKTKLNPDSLPFYGESSNFFNINESSFFNKHNNCISPRRTGDTGYNNSGSLAPSGFFNPLGKKHEQKTHRYSISMMCWNAHSINTIIKRTFLNTRREDILMINETWGINDKFAESGYKILKKNRDPGKIGGGVAILIKEDFQVQEIEVPFKETIMAKITFNRSKTIYLITSYFPSAPKSKWEKRWMGIKRAIEEHCPAKYGSNIVIAGDWNKDIIEDEQFCNEIKSLNLKVMPIESRFTFQRGEIKSRIDFFVIAAHMSTDEKVFTQRTPSDHFCCTMNIYNAQEIQRIKVQIPNRKLAKDNTERTLDKFNGITQNFFREYKEIIMNNNRKDIVLRRNTRYKDELLEIFMNNDFQEKLIKVQLTQRWEETWTEIERARFSPEQGSAFDQIRRITKYDKFEKRDGSIITKVNVNGEVISNPREVNIYLREALSKLTGEKETPSYVKREHFPNLKPLEISELQNLATKLKKNKAIAADYVHDSALFERIANCQNTARGFCDLWSAEVMNDHSVKFCLTGRLVPLNKVHPNIPKPDEMRPIIALSPIFKLIEARFKPKLEAYLSNRMIKSQIGFVSKCGTHMNIHRMLKRTKNLRESKTKATILFIDFKSAYNNVQLDILFNLLKNKRILADDEVEFIRALYSHTKLTIGKEKVSVNKGVMQGSIISPSLFNIFSEDLIVSLVNQLGIENVFAYADDLRLTFLSKV